MKTLVAFFSHPGETYFPDGFKYVKEGNAKIIAKKVKDLLKADIFEIDTIKKYPDGYDDCCKVAKIEKQKSELPELKEYLDSIDKYEKIVLVYPCWWGTIPQPVVTFLKHYDFSNKVILPICTHEGTRMGQSEKDIIKYTNNIKLLKGLAIQGAKASTCDDVLEETFKKW